MSSKVQVICEENCNNAPKKQLLRDLMTALVNNDIAFFIEWVTEDVVWKIVGKHHILGSDSVKKELQKIHDLNITLLHIDNIITHGNVASLNGFIERENMEPIHFCHVYRFNGFGKKAKIKTITSYIIK